MAIVTRRYRWVAANLPAIQLNGDPGSVLVALGYTTHVDVTFDNAISDAVVVDLQMQLLGFVFETAAPVGVPNIDVSDFLRYIERVGDPAAEANNNLVYAKDVAGITQLFARASDGTITQLTPVANSDPGLAFGNTNVAAAADTRYLEQWSSVGTAGTTETSPIVLWRGGTLKNMRVRHQAAVGNGNSVVYTVRVNGVSSLLTATLASGAIGTASDLVNTVVVAAGDRITLQAVKPLALGNGGVAASITMEFAA